VKYIAHILLIFLSKLLQKQKQILKPDLYQNLFVFIYE